MSNIDFYLIGCRLTALKVKLIVLSVSPDLEAVKQQLESRVEFLNEAISSGFFIDSELINSQINDLKWEIHELVQKNNEVRAA